LHLLLKYFYKKNNVNIYLNDNYDHEYKSDHYQEDKHHQDTKDNERKNAKSYSGNNKWIETCTSGINCGGQCPAITTFVDL